MYSINQKMTWWKYLKLKHQNNENGKKMLLQSLFYGLCKKKSIFRIHLINVFLKWMHNYRISKDLHHVLQNITDDLQLYNLNCYLSKNRQFLILSRRTFILTMYIFLMESMILKSEWKQLVLFSESDQISALFFT